MFGGKPREVINGVKFSGAFGLSRCSVRTADEIIAQTANSVATAAHHSSQNVDAAEHPMSPTKGSAANAEARSFSLHRLRAQKVSQCGSVHFQAAR
jgi:hypothetical protein